MSSRLGRVLVPNCQLSSTQGCQSGLVGKRENGKLVANGSGILVRQVSLLCLVNIILVLALSLW